MSKLSNVVDDDSFSKTVVKKVKTDYDTRLKEIKRKILNHYKCIPSNDFNEFSGALFDETIKQATLATKADLADFVTKTYFNDKLQKINFKENETFRGWKETKQSTKKASRISIKGYNLLLGRIYILPMMMVMKIFKFLYQC